MNLFQAKQAKYTKLFTSTKITHYKPLIPDNLCHMQNFVFTQHPKAVSFERKQLYIIVIVILNKSVAFFVNNAIHIFARKKKNVNEFYTKSFSINLLVNSIPHSHTESILSMFL